MVERVKDPSANKVLLFTHGIDIDGYGCAVLAKLAFGDKVDIFYADNTELDDMFSQAVYGASAKEVLSASGEKKAEMLKNARKNLCEYRQIYITDHCLGLDLCKFVNEDTSTVNKLLVLDHHASRKAEQGQFPWVKIEDNLGSTKACGTNLFYYHLINQKRILPQFALAIWARFTALYDTWTWKGSGHEEECQKLNNLALAVGRDEYVRQMTEYFKHLKSPGTTFEFSKAQEKIVNDFVAAKNAELSKIAAGIQVVKVGGKKIGKFGYVEILDKYKNDLAEYVRSTPNDLDFLCTPILDRQSVSLRNVKEDFDVSKVAQAYGGGGHFGAASIPKENFPSVQEFAQQLKNFGTTDEKTKE